MSDGESLPTGWIEAEQNDRAANKYDPRRPVTFNYESGDVQVFVHPATQNRPETDVDRWQVDASDQSVRDPDDDRGSDSMTAEGREGALALAREFMEAYNSRKDIDEARRSVKDDAD